MERCKGYPRLSVCGLLELCCCCVYILYTHSHTHNKSCTFVHQCTHHKCVKWGYYCHIAGRLAAPVLITLLLLRLPALLFYLSVFWQVEVCKLSSVSNFHSSGCHSWEPQLGFQARVWDNKAFFQQDELTNSRAERQVFVEGQTTARIATSTLTVHALQYLQCLCCLHSHISLVCFISVTIDTFQI